MNLLFKRDWWIKPVTYDKTICYNPFPETFYFYKIGFFKHNMGFKNEHVILEEFLQYKNTFFKNRKVKALFILPNKAYCEFMKINLENANFFNDIDFSFKHKIEITLQNNKGFNIENEFYDLIFIKEDITLEWLAKKNINLNSTFKIYLHNGALTSKAYSHLLNQI